MLRLGVCGLTSDHVWGMVGGFFGVDEEVSIVAVAEPYHPELIERARREWSVARNYNDYEALLDNEEIDAVIVCANNRDKARIVAAAARHRRHVLADKPMAATYSQAAEMAKAAAAARIHLMIAYHNAFNAVHPRIKALLEAGTIGRPYLAKGGVGHAGPREIGCSDAFCEWLFDQELNGGGSFIDEACYTINMFRSYLGEVSRVGAFTTQMGHRDYLPPGVEDNAVAILQFESGALGVIDAKWGQIGPYPISASIHGVDGTILIGRGEYQLFAPKLLPEGAQGWVRVARPSPRAGRGGLEQQHFVDVLRGREALLPEVSPEGALRTQAVIEAVYASARSGRMVATAEVSA